MSAHDGKRTTLPPLADLAAAIRDGLTVVDLAATFGISHHTLRERLNHGGWDVHGEPMVETPPRREPVVGFLQGDTSWMSDARCAEVGGDDWFPERGKGHTATTAAAKALCGECPARQACLDVALADPSLAGIWGGTTPGERVELRKGRAA